MAAKKKAGLPETSVNAPEHKDLVDQAALALKYRKEIADLETQLADAKKLMAEGAEVVRAAKEAATDGEYIGLVRITDPNQSPTQVQFKISGGALDLAEGENLDALFGAARPMLFEKDLVITGIANPDALIAELRAQGKNPWDFLTLTVNKGLDLAVAAAATPAYITKEEAYLPKEGFLATLNEFKNSLTAAAKEYIRKYLLAVLKPTVDLGKK